jgi:hypothetical protein
MGSRTLSGILWNLLILWLIVCKTISLFLDMVGSMFIIWKVISNVLLILICLLLFRGPSIREVEMSKGKEMAGKLKIMTYITWVILFVNIFVGMSTIFSWSVQMILYSVMLILYVVFTALQILIHFKYKDL